MPSETPHHRRVLPHRCIVRIDENGLKDRVKDASRFACNGVPCLRPVPTLMWRRTTAFPSLATFRHPLSPARSVPAEEAADTDHEPTKASIPAAHREACRLPRNRDVFCRHDTRRNVTRRDRSLRPSCRLSRPRRPHFFPILGRVLCWALQMSWCGHPRSVTVPPAGGSRVQTPFLLSESRLGLTTQARPAARTTRPSTGADCPARTDVARSA